MKIESQLEPNGVFHEVKIGQVFLHYDAYFMRTAPTYRKEATAIAYEAVNLKDGTFRNIQLHEQVRIFPNAKCILGTPNEDEL